MTDVTGLNQILTRIAGLSHHRNLIAVIGPPASGKSTLAEKLADALTLKQAGSASVLGQDGFHFDNAILKDLGALSRKGAPHTFDVSGLAAMLDRLLISPSEDIHAPQFDRDLDLSRNAAVLIPASAKYVIVEGNYLLLNDPPWDRLFPKFSLTVSINVGDDELRRRLTERWSGLPSDDATQKIDQNDLPNAAYVRARSRPTDLVIAQG